MYKLSNSNFKIKLFSDGLEDNNIFEVFKFNNNNVK